jgi:hypothetical protein
MKSPFKFLDAFTLQDKDAFFGRDQEVDTLYSMVFKTPLILVYGLSGTGKTSLVQCGLASRFDGPDWYPLFIRRNDNINTSISTVMRNALGPQTGDNLAENVSLLLRKTLRPVYLLFDQLEELFILGKEEEQTTFMQSIRSVLDANLAAKIILIMREEYIGQLYKYELLVPELFDHRFRVEPMGPGKVKNVIRCSCQKFNIELAEPQEELLGKMIQNINDPRSGITLPYLQVYLDMMYRDKYRKQYGQSEQPGYPALEINLRDIESIGKIDNVLERFLEDQIKEIHQTLLQQHKNLPSSIVQTVLDGFVSEEGTKKPINYTQSGKDIQLTDKTTDALTQIPAALLSDVLHHLLQNRILRQNDESLELAHDSLAVIIDSRRSEAQRRLQNIRKRLLNAFEEYQKTGAFLNQKQLASFEEFLPQLGLSPEIEKFLELCELDIARKTQEEADRLQQETRMAQQKKVARMRGIWLTIACILGGLAGFMAWKSSERAKLLEINERFLTNAYNKSKLQQDSIANIVIQVDQQFGRLDSVMSGKLPESELVKSIILLKSLVRKDTIDAEAMAVSHVSVIAMFTTSRLHPNMALSVKDSVLQSRAFYLALHLKTPQPKEWIQVKWFDREGKILGEPAFREIESRGDTAVWVSVKAEINEAGKYRVEVYNSLGLIIGESKFRIAESSADVIKLTKESNFRTMASGTVKEPGPSVTHFNLGGRLHYWFRIHSPKAGEIVTVELIDKNGKQIWDDDHETGQNTMLGYRGFGIHGCNAAGTFYIRLVNSNGEELAGHTVTVE